MNVAILSPYPTFPFHDELECREISYENNATWTVALADALAQLPDTQVHVLTESTFIPRSRTLQVNNVTLHFIKAPEQFKTLTFWHFDRIRLHGMLAKIKPDIVHGQGIENQYGDAAVSSPYRHLLTVHGIPELSNRAQEVSRFSRLHIVEHTGKRCVAAARNIVVINPFVAEYLNLSHAGRRLFPIPNAVTPQFFEPSTVEREPNLLLAIGWLDRLKAHDIFARALALLRRRGVKVRARVIGPLSPSPYFEALQRYVREEQLDIQFTGFLRPDQIAAELRRCTVMVHPSRQEVSPMAICEAMACATPVVAARVGGVGHIIRDGETGLLFAPANATELADQLERLLADAPQRQRLGDNAGRYAREHFHPSVVAAQTRAAYTTLLGAESGTMNPLCAASTAN